MSLDTSDDLALKQQAVANFAATGQHYNPQPSKDRSNRGFPDELDLSSLPKNHSPAYHRD